MSNARIHIQDIPTGDWSAGQLAYPSNQLTSPTKQIAARYTAKHEAITCQFW